MNAPKVRRGAQAGRPRSAGAGALVQPSWRSAGSLCSPARREPGTGGSGATPRAKAAVRADPGGRRRRRCPIVSSPSGGTRSSPRGGSPRGHAVGERWFHEAGHPLPALAGAPAAQDHSRGGPREPVQGGESAARGSAHRSGGICAVGGEGSVHRSSRALEVGDKRRLDGGVERRALLLGREAHGRGACASRFRKGVVAIAPGVRAVQGC